MFSNDAGHRFTTRLLASLVIATTLAAVTLTHALSGIQVVA